MSSQLETFYYDNKIVRNFAYATIAWSLITFLIVILAALELVWPWFNLGLKYTIFGRMRPLHINAVVFAFVGNGIFIGIYYALQRLLKTRMYSDLLSKIHFWGWQLIIVFAVLSSPLDFTLGKEYAILEWPIDAAIAAVWIVFGINMFMTILKRREPYLHVAIWFYIATWVVVTVLYVGTHIEVSADLMKPYPVFAGIQAALVQWWYGPNAIVFFLTTPYLGLIYYFLPKMVNQPVYSYQMSIIHFWALILIYIWAVPHYLLCIALPDWAQTLGIVFSVILIVPFWSGMLNGLLTLRESWRKASGDPILKFIVVAVIAYGMVIFESPMISTKAVNMINPYTDWTDWMITHIHTGTLGWNGFLIFGILYWLLPRIFKTKLYAVKLANQHFWIGTLGILCYAVSPYWADFIQSFIWKEFIPEGIMVHGNFLATVTRTLPTYALRTFGSILYIIGALMMIYNLIKTVKSGELEANEVAQAPAIIQHVTDEYGYIWAEARPTQILVGSLIVILISSLVKIVPTLLVSSNVPQISAVTLYTPLELQGQDIYIKEGCYSYHFQTIRPFRLEAKIYGKYSKAKGFIYDRSFEWESKHTGPNLYRIGGKYPNDWHYNHMIDPISTSVGSTMPSYVRLAQKGIDQSSTPAKIRGLQMLNVPYPDGYDKVANEDLMIQAEKIAAELKGQGIKIEPQKELIALIAYLKRLGTGIEKVSVVEEK